MIHEGLTLREIGERKRFAHAGISGQQVRFAMTSSGRLLIGDAYEVLHKDICYAFEGAGDKSALFVGYAIEKPDGSWLIHFQGFSTEPEKLSMRMTTWLNFIDGAKIQVADKWQDL